VTNQFHEPAHPFFSAGAEGSNDLVVAAHNFLINCTRRGRPPVSSATYKGTFASGRRSAVENRNDRWTAIPTADTNATALTPRGKVSDCRVFVIAFQVSVLHVCPNATHITMPSDRRHSNVFHLEGTMLHRRTKTMTTATARIAVLPEHPVCDGFFSSRRSSHPVRQEHCQTL
jgi:hypothetical protein